jgi:SAM-dependent methyltransferase
LRARVDDLLRGLRTPGNSARLRLVGELLAGEVLDPGSPAAGTFMLANLQRVLEETTRFNQRMAEAKSDAQVFRDRGVSVDTGILPNFAIETALRRMQERGLLRSGEIARAAVIGPGLDFTDKESGYDFYPLQTLQPFALYNTLMRLGVARPSITVFDISPRVLDHLRAARGGSYTVQLPRDSSAAWNPEAIAYWRSFGDQAGESVEPIAPPPLLPMVTTRAVRFPREVVDGIATEDLNIVVGRLRGASFDLIVATNILVYYDAFEQALALANIAAMLKPGGFLLTNDALPEARSVPMRLLERTAVNYVAQPRSGDTVYWYQRQRSGVY